uniref:Uncharacterized protein n=1 Tax=Tanacetum cinerariifolium TaxID=118510 RepID=A0A699I1G3_TANCI|nr:hypothetical protein [Tanacetum cinerariifolium]
MSSASSTVTYTSVYTDSESGRVFWRADEELSDGGSLRVIVYGYDGLPMLPVAPPSPDYPHDLDSMPEPIYPGYIPLKDEHVLPAKEQQLPHVVSPAAESPEYVAKSDPEEDPEEYEDDETEDGLVDYPMDGGDDRDDDDGDSFGDDANDEDEDEEEEEDEEHLSPADYAIVIPTYELVSPPEGAEPAAISFPLEAEVERLLAMPTPSPSTLTSLSPPSTKECLARCTAPAALPSPPLPPPLRMPPPVDRRDDILKTEMPPRKRLCFSTLGSRYEVRESFTARPTKGRAINYGFVSLDAEERRRGIGENRPAFYNNGDDDDDDDDDDEDCTIAITPDFLIADSFIMGDEHLDTIPEKESDEFNKSSVEDLVPNPREFEDECECDMSDCDDSQTINFSTFSNPCFDDSTSSADKSSHEEDIQKMSFKTYSNPLFDLDEEIISSEFNPIHNEDLDSTLKNDHFDTDSYLFESSLNHDTLMISSLKIDSLLAEFVEFVSENSNANIESFFPSLIPNEDSVSFIEEIYLFLTPDDPMPPSIEEDDDDSERDILIREELLDNYSLSLPVNE